MQKKNYIAVKMGASVKNSQETNGPKKFHSDLVAQ